MNAVDPSRIALLTTTVATETDVFALRRAGRTVAQELGLENQDQVRFATALSELGRDLLGSTGLTADFALAPRSPATLVVTLRWEGGAGLSAESLRAARRLVPAIAHQGGAPGKVLLEQPLPPTARPAGQLAERARGALRSLPGTTSMEELRAQGRELITALEDSRARREELQQLNNELQRLNQELQETNQGVLALYTELSQELEETNSGVVALYAELDDKSRLLREASQAKTRFWANISHELRSPVNSVIGLSRLLLDDLDDPDNPDNPDDPDDLDDKAAAAQERRHQLSLIAASGATLLALVDELLDVAKAESGTLEPHWTRVDLRALLGQLHGTMRDLAGDGVALVVPEPPAAAELVSDEVMLTRILRNLLSNALKFTAEGEVRLTAETEPQCVSGEAGGAPEEGAWLVFTVADTGVGIPVPEQERIFEEFYQVRGPHQRGRAGTGLGLPYARRLAELLGGTLTVGDRPDHGSVFTLRLPVRARAAGPAVPADPYPGGTGGRLATLLTVDDDAAFRAGIRPILAQLAERVVEVARSSEALATIRRERPDAVLLDLNMPDPDGYTLLAQLAEDPLLREIPTFLLTSAAAALLDTARLGHARAVLDKRGLTAGALAEAFAREGIAPRGSDRAAPPAAVGHRSQQPPQSHQSHQSRNGHSDEREGRP
ncbi:ATP-binding protein [Kitasatospora sp. NBC_01287]|uniref:ATP-binding response regulator n=1 Tax=Kitasatospora sp. NBC_01287 TaxID=2903573 RepID=UPI00224CABFA|nr:ATP-binding protein [Kitasatospora sp. NBC_01287]MCX4744620.1 ATP-binding protein [Kitasatospora sp. NBC_01287]